MAISVRVPLPHGAVCCFAVCNSGISLSYSLTFCTSLCENNFLYFLTSITILLNIVLFNAFLLCFCILINCLITYNLLNHGQFLVLWVICI